MKSFKFICVQILMIKNANTLVYKIVQIVTFNLRIVKTENSNANNCAKCGSLHRTNQKKIRYKSEEWKDVYKPILY